MAKWELPEVQVSFSRGDAFFIPWPQFINLIPNSQGINLLTALPYLNLNNLLHLIELHFMMTSGIVLYAYNSARIENWSINL